MEGAPSVRARIAQSIALLVGFYAMMLATACVLVVVPVLVIWFGQSGSGLTLILAVTLVPAFLILKGMVSARPPRFESPGRKLVHADAPELFARLDALASRLGAPGPAEIHLSPEPTLAVLERGGLFGIGSRRVLVIGAPTLSFLTVSELDAGLAHELGHFHGGDTRLGGVIGYTHASFRAVLEATGHGDPRGHANVFLHFGIETSRFISAHLVGRYARFYFRTTMRAARAQELAADRASAALVGSRAAMRVLERFSMEAPLYRAYLRAPVTRAYGLGALPTDLLAGFADFRDAVERSGDAEKLRAAIAAETTDPFDTHPALSERLASLSSMPEVDAAQDDRPARALLADPAALDGWLHDATRAAFVGPKFVTSMRWDEIPTRAFPETARARARSLVAVLSPLEPRAPTPLQMLRFLLDAMAQGRGREIALRLEPAVGQIVAGQQAPVATLLVGSTVAALLEAALVELGADVELPWTDPHAVFTWRGDRIAARALALDAMRSGEALAALRGWVDRLATAQSAAI